MYAVDGAPRFLWVAGTLTALAPGAVVCVTWDTPHGLATTPGEAAATARRPAAPLPDAAPGEPPVLVARLLRFPTPLAPVLPPVLWLAPDHPRAATARTLLDALGPGAVPEHAGEFRRRASRALVATLTAAAVDRGLGPAAGDLDALADPYVGPVLAALHAEPGAAWTVRRLAALVGISGAHLAERFSAVTGTTVIAYRGLLRARVAEHVLRETDLPLAEIARSLGYESHPAFHRAFARLTGRTPGQVRRDRDGSTSGPVAVGHRWPVGVPRD